MLTKLLAIVLWVCLAAFSQQRPPELNSILMESTFKIQGPKNGDPTKTSFGTAFLLAKPKPGSSNNMSYYVLVSAKHVYEDIAGDTAYIILRIKRPDESYEQKAYPVPLRSKGVALYVSHKDADVAAVYVDMPDDYNSVIVPTPLLATDELIRQYEVHPGDELNCLGFPLFVSSDSGFPILRSGKIASYPLLPTSVNKRFMFDFHVYEGNSGGPVYMVSPNRFYGGSTHIGIVQMMVGLVTSQVGSIPYNNQLISIGAVVPAPYIVETLALLPPESPYK